MKTEKETIKDFEKLMEELKKTGFLTDDAVNLISTIFQYSIDVFNQENLLEKELLNQAEEDLKSAKLLYENKIYPNSTYLLEQATEKIAKAWCLHFRFIEEGDLKQVGHKIPRAFIRGLKTNIGTLSLQLLRATTKEQNYEIKKLEDIIYKSKEISKITYDEISTIIEAINQIEHIIKNEFNKYDIIISKHIINDLINLLISFMWVYIISMIMFPHAEYTRSPRLSNYEGLSPTDYTNELGIFQSTPKLIPYLEISLKTLRDYLEFSSK